MTTNDTRGPWTVCDGDGIEYSHHALKREAVAAAEALGEHRAASGARGAAVIRVRDEAIVWSSVQEPAVRKAAKVAPPEPAPEAAPAEQVALAAVEDEVPNPDRVQRLQDRRVERMIANAEAAGWDAFADALRKRLGRPAAKAWTRDLTRALKGVYDPADPQADKAARAAYLFAQAFTDERYADDPAARNAQLHTTSYWTARHLAAAGVKGVGVAPAPTPPRPKDGTRRTAASAAKAAK
jgi:hypothetical protein